MNEFDLLEAFRDEVPLGRVPAGAQALFEAGLAAEQRARAARRARRAAPGQALRRWARRPGGRGWRLALAGGLSAAVAAGCVAMLMPGLAAPTRGDLTASEVAFRTAAVAGAQPYVGPNRWVYLKLTTGRGPALREWYTANGRWQAQFEHGRLISFPGLPFSQPRIEVQRPSDLVKVDQAVLRPAPVGYDDVATLPRRPAALDVWLERRYEPGFGSRADWAFEVIDNVLTSYVVPPARAAELYRALGALPGVTVDSNAMDVAGRRGIGLSLEMSAVAPGAIEEIVINRQSFTLMGDQVLLPKRVGGPGRFVWGQAILAQAVVSGPGATR
jgi:hypothetical protein